MSRFAVVIKKHFSSWFLVAVLLFVFAYSIPTLTTKPAYWYDEGINVELARNFADFGKLDLVVAPNTFSGKGATVGSTGYPITVPLAGFFKLFGFGLEQARMYMLLWMSVLIAVFFFIALKLWGARVAYGGILLIATFAPFYGNGRSVMGEIPGFLFFLLSFLSFERRKPCLAGIFLGLAVVSKPSVFVFLLPAFALLVFCGAPGWKKKILDLLRLGGGALLALVPWFFIYVEEFARGGIGANILAHFKNPYQEAGVSVWTNMSNNIGTFFQSTTLLYFTVLFVLVSVALYLDRELFRTHRSIFLLSAVYIPLAFFQYLKSAGYLRYLIAAELLIFVLFLLALPAVVRWALRNSPFPKGSTPEEGGISKSSALSGTSFPRYAGGFGEASTKGGVFTVTVLAAMVLMQTIHLFWFADIYPSEKTQKTMAHISRGYPLETIGVFDVPQIGSLLSAHKKYQYLSTYGLWQFGINPLLLPQDILPRVLVINSTDTLTVLEREALSTYFEPDAVFSDGFLVYRGK